MRKNLFETLFAAAAANPSWSVSLSCNGAIAMTGSSSWSVRSLLALLFFFQSTVVASCLTGSPLPAATITNVGLQEREAPSLQSAPQNEATSPPRLETAGDWNRQL